MTGCDSDVFCANKGTAPGMCAFTGDDDRSSIVNAGTPFPAVPLATLPTRAAVGAALPAGRATPVGATGIGRTPAGKVPITLTAGGLAVIDGGALEDGRNTAGGLTKTGLPAPAAPIALVDRDKASGRTTMGARTGDPVAVGSTTGLTGANDTDGDGDGDGAVDLNGDTLTCGENKRVGVTGMAWFTGDTTVN